MVVAERTMPSIDRLPPHSPEAEQGVLACIFLDGKCIAECIDKFADAEVFYDLRHREIYNAMVELYDARAEIDLIAVLTKLRDRHQDEHIGGAGYLSTLPDAAPSAANLPHYIDILLEKAMARKLLHACTSAVGRVYESSDSPRQLVEAHERDVLSILTQRPSAQTPIKEAVVQAINEIEALHQKSGATGIRTGFCDFDRLTCGLRGGEMVVIAARPSMGKTSLMMNIVEHAAVDQSLPVGVFSLEMKSPALVQRMLCSRARVDAHAVREGSLVASDFPKLVAAAGAISRSPLFIDDTPGLSITQLRSKARRMHQLHGIKLLAVDYLQLMNAGRRIDSRQVEVSLISGGIKELALELNIPVLVLSQLNRDMERGIGRSKSAAPRKPRLSDLRESGSIEQDADVVGLLWRPDEDEEQALDLIVAKQRNGPTGDIALTFLKPYTRFENAARVSPEDDE